MQDDEESLIRRAQGGERQAFGTLVQQHQSRVFSLIRRLCGNTDHALDLTQDTFIKAWHALPDWRPEARLQTWLLRIARNTTIDALRRRQPVIEPLPDGRPEARLQPWLPRMPRNTTRAALRRRQPVSEPLPEEHMLVAPGPTPLHQLESRRRLAQLERLISQLPTGQREVLLLREVDGLAYREIADTLNISEGTVKSRLARARDALLEARAALTGDSDD